MFIKGNVDLIVAHELAFPQLHCHSLTTFWQRFWWGPFALTNQNLLKVELTFLASVCCHVNPALFKAYNLIGRAIHNTSEICHKHSPCTSSAAYNTLRQTSERPSRQMEKRKLIRYSSKDSFCQRTYPNRRRKAFAVESYSEVLWFGSNLFHDVVEELGLLFLFRQDTIQKDQHTESDCPVPRQTMTVLVKQGLRYWSILACSK